MQIVIVSGISGSGKTTALRTLEDMGYYAIDNLPIALLDKLLEVFRSDDEHEIEKLALVVDGRSGQSLEDVPQAIEAARHAGHGVDVLLLDAPDEVVTRRYSETRRVHPLADGGSVAEGIQRERLLLMPLRREASWTLDTADMSVHDLKRSVLALFTPSEDRRSRMATSVISFGFRHGVPQQADLVFDVRFIPNPYFVEELRPLTGKNPEVAAYVLERDEAKAFLAKLEPLLEFLLPRYEDEGKAYLTIAIGCTGGQHRSVAISERLAGWVRELGRDVRVRHRDMAGS